MEGDGDPMEFERVDSWEHDGRSSLGGGSYSSSRTLRNRDHDPILIEMMEPVLGL